jgi:hypothetical protein
MEVGGHFHAPITCLAQDGDKWVGLVVTLDVTDWIGGCVKSTGFLTKCRIKNVQGSVASSHEIG